MFYGHSESYSTLGSGGHGTPLDDAVAEWRALQRVKTPFLLANHLTWLRDQGFHQDTRLLTTVADRPPRHLDLVQSREGGGQLLYDGLRREGTTKNDRDHHRPDTPFVPLESFLRLLPDGGVSEKPHRLYGSREDPGRVPLAHSISMRSGRRRRPGDEETTGGVAERGPCGFLHLVVDGVEFQVNAATPSGISRVWTNVLPLVSGVAERRAHILRRMLRDSDTESNVFLNIMCGQRYQRAGARARYEKVWAPQRS